MEQYLSWLRYICLALETSGMLLSGAPAEMIAECAWCTEYDSLSFYSYLASTTKTVRSPISIKELWSIYSVLRRNL